MRTGEKKTITLSPEEAYGNITDERLREFPRETFPPEFELKLGATMRVEGEEGRAFPGIVTGIKEDIVTVNFNHPLAGKTLNFDIEVVDVK